MPPAASFKTQDANVSAKLLVINTWLVNTLKPVFNLSNVSYHFLLFEGNQTKKYATFLFMRKVDSVQYYSFMYSVCDSIGGGGGGGRYTYADY